MDKIKVGIFVGSLRKGAFSKIVAKKALALMPESIQAELVDIGQLELYNQDLETADNIPTSWSAFRDTVKNYDAFLFVTPEYNRSIPAVLKNALDVGSRPMGSSVWSGKPGGIISVSPGNIGAFGANHHLRQVMAFLDVYMLQQPEAYLGNITENIDDSGNLSAKTETFLQKYIDAYCQWIARF